MKLFDGFEAVKFFQENMILITHNGYIYYVYSYSGGYWIKYRNCGNDHITIQNYDEVTREELMGVMNGIFPKKATAFMRLCPTSQLDIGDMMALLEEDYPRYFSDYEIRNAIHRLLRDSDIPHKSFERIRELLDNATANATSNPRVIAQIKRLCLSIMGRDIFKKEIKIVDGHDGSSYFWIMPIRIIDSSDTGNTSNVAKMRSSEISIEEYDVSKYLTPFLYKYFDDELEANKNRIEYKYIDDDGNEQVSRISGFEWYLTDNFFTFESMKSVLNDVKETVKVLSSGTENEFSDELKKHTEPELLIDFYNRFIYRMEYMMKVGEEKGYDLISFMGP